MVPCNPAYYCAFLVYSHTLNQQNTMSQGHNPDLRLGAFPFNSVYMLSRTSPTYPTVSVKGYCFSTSHAKTLTQTR